MPHGEDVKFIWRFGKIALGYFAYVLPIGIVVYLSLFIRYNSLICQEMKAPFLLDNLYEPSVNMTDFYIQRIHAQPKPYVYQDRFNGFANNRPG